MSSHEIHKYLTRKSINLIIACLQLEQVTYEGHLASKSVKEGLSLTFLL